ncbi:MAG: hypothetical protein ACRD0U_04690, partial [Acidimicrobiales bacterium]
MTASQRSGSGAREMGDWWVAACGLGLIMAAEYEWRQRDVVAAVSAGLDTQVLAELAVYALVGGYLVTRLRPSSRGQRRFLASALTVYIGAMLLAAVHSPFPRLALARSVQLVIGGLLAVAIERGAKRAD